VQEALGKNKGFDYARTAHPNRRALERCVARLEQGQSAYVFTTGMAAIDAMFRLLRPGDHAIVSEAVYGGVYRLTTQLLVHFGLEFSFVDTSNLAAVRNAIRPTTKMIYAETPTNPTMIITDIAEVAKVAHEKGLTLAVDNTFLSPYLQRPISLGADIVVHSMTKYLNGHSDATGGAVVLTRPEDAEKIYFRSGTGANGLFSGGARDQDSGGTNEATRRQRDGSSAFSGRPPHGEAGPVPGARVASAACHRAQATARLRRHDLV
jgi:cystathionine beta-lyase/cystathionine gamma-synthase